ncbi:hypothetical protein HZS_7001, partial [Henneguya salminicola]
MTDSNYIDENAPQKFENHQTYMDPSLNPSCNYYPETDYYISTDQFNSQVHGHAHSQPPENCTYQDPQIEFQNISSSQQNKIKISEKSNEENFDLNSNINNKLNLRQENFVLPSDIHESPEYTTVGAKHNQIHTETQTNSALNYNSTPVLFPKDDDNIKSLENINCLSPGIINCERSLPRNKNQEPTETDLCQQETIPLDKKSTCACFFNTDDQNVHLRRKDENIDKIDNHCSMSSASIEKMESCSDILTSNEIYGDSQLFDNVSEFENLCEKLSECRIRNIPSEPEEKVHNVSLEKNQPETSQMYSQTNFYLAGSSVLTNPKTSTHRSVSRQAVFNPQSNAYQQYVRTPITALTNKPYPIGVQYIPHQYIGQYYPQPYYTHPFHQTMIAPPHRQPQHVPEPSESSSFRVDHPYTNSYQNYDYTNSAFVKWQQDYTRWYQAYGESNDRQNSFISNRNLHQSNQQYIPDNISTFSETSKSRLESICTKYTERIIPTLQKSRNTPPLYASSHSFSRFSPNNTIVTHSLGKLQIFSINCSKIAEDQDFPGPLKNDPITRRKLLGYIKKTVKHKMKSEHRHIKLLWQLFFFIIKGNGLFELPDLSDTLIKYNPVLHVSPLSTTQSSLSVDSYSEIFSSLRNNDIKKSLSIAIESKNWGLSFALCAQNRDLYDHTLRKYMETLDIIDMLRSYISLQSNTPLNISSMNPNDIINNWNQYLSLFLSQTHIDCSFYIECISKILHSKGRYPESQICRLILDLVLKKPQDHSQIFDIKDLMEDYFIEPTLNNILYLRSMEMYEYIKVISDPDFIFSHLQMYKFLYAETISQSKQKEKAYDYVHLITLTILRDSLINYSLGFLYQLLQLCRRLFQYLFQNVDYPEWILKLTNLVVNYSNISEPNPTQLISCISAPDVRVQQVTSYGLKKPIASHDINQKQKESDELTEPSREMSTSKAITSSHPLVEPSPKLIYERIDESLILVSNTVNETPTETPELDIVIPLITVPIQGQPKNSPSLSKFQLPTSIPEKSNQCLLLDNNVASKSVLDSKKPDPIIGNSLPLNLEETQQSHQQTQNPIISGATKIFS